MLLTDMQVVPDMQLTFFSLTTVLYFLYNLLLSWTFLISVPYHWLKGE